MCAEGFITYHRTDATTVSESRVGKLREAITNLYPEAGALLQDPRLYKSRAKNAQEAHEAILATDILENRPPACTQHLDRACRWVHHLVWLRSIACQMPDAKIERVRTPLRRAPWCMISLCALSLASWCMIPAVGQPINITTAPI